MKPKYAYCKPAFTKVVATFTSMPVLGLAAVASLIGIVHGQNVWTGAENANWDNTSANWAGPTIWVAGGAASIPSGSGAVHVTENVTASALTIPGANDTIVIDAGKTLSIERATVSPQNITNGGWTTRLRGAGTLRIDSSATWSGNNWGPDSGAATVYHPGFTGTLHVVRGRTDASPAGFGGVSTVKVGSGGQFLGWAGTYPQQWELAGAGAGEGGQPGALRAAAGQNMNLTGGVILTGNAEILTQDTASVITFQQPITGVGDLTLHAKGKFNFPGSVSNSFNGNLTINTTAGAAASSTITFDKTGGALAVPAGKTVQYGVPSGTGQVNLRMSQSQQFGPGVRMNFGNTNGNWARFDLMGTRQTLAGLHTGSTSATPNGAVIQNRESSGTANRGASILTLNGNLDDANYPVGGYIYNGYLRDADSGDNPDNRLALVKDGTGTQGFAGAQFHLEGGVTVNGGNLDFLTGNCMDNANGGWTVNAGGTLRAVAAQNVNGGLTVNGGTLAGIGAPNATWGHMVMGGNVTIGGTKTSVMSAGIIIAGNNNRTFTVNPTGDPSGIDLDVTGMFSHAAGQTWGYLTKAGSGVMRFAPTSSGNIGSITVNAGKIVFDDVIQGMGNGGLFLNSGTVEINAAANPVAFNQAISGVGSLVKKGANGLTLGGNSGFNGTLTIEAGSLTLGGSGRIGAGNHANSVVNHGVLAFDTTADQILSGGLTGSGSLTKKNTGRVWIQDASYTGTTDILAGTAIFTSSKSGAVTVSDGATLGGTLEAPAITLGGGGGVNLLVNPASPIVSTGNLTVNGTVTVGLLAGFTPGTPFPIVQYAGKAGVWDKASFTLANSSSYRGFTFDDTGSAITLAIQGLSLEWNNAATTAVWNLNADANFTDGSSNQKFVFGDAVKFGNLPGADSVVSLEGMLSPSAVLVDSQYTYTLGGTGVIAGGASLTKAGNGLLYVDTANTYTGPTTLSGGRLAVGIDNALGTGPILPGAGVLSSDSNAPRSLANALNLTGTLHLGDAIDDGVLTLNGAVTLGAGATVDTLGTAVLNGPVLASANGLTKTGVGRLTLGGTSFFTGPILVNAGTLQLNATGASGGPGSITVAADATLAVGPNVTTNMDRAITMSAGALLDTTPNNAGQTAVVAGRISGSDGLTVKANGDLSDTGGGSGGAAGLANLTNDFTGDVTILAGLVRAQSGFGSNSNKIILDGGGLVDQNANVQFTRDIVVGPNGGVYRTYGNVGGNAGIYGELSSSIPGVTLRRTDGGTINLAGNGAGFDGTFLNARGNLNIDSRLWQSTGFVNMDGGTLRIRNTGGTTHVASLMSDRDVHIEPGARLNLVSGNYSFGEAAGAFQTNQAFWMQNTGRLTSSSGVLKVDTPRSYVDFTGATAIRVHIEDYDSGTPLQLVKNGAGQLSLFDTVSSYTGGTIINGGRIQVQNAQAFGTGTIVTTGDGTGDSGGIGGQVWLSTTTPIANPFVIGGRGSTEGAGELGAIRFENGTGISGSLTVAPGGARIVAYNGAVGTVTGALLGTGNLEINAASTNPFNGTINLLGNTSAYQGNITVSQGRLNLPGNTLGGLTVAATGNFAGEGSLGGDITLAANSTLHINPSTSAAVTAGDELIAPAGPVNVALNGPVPLGGGEVAVAAFASTSLDEFDLPFVLVNPTTYRPGSGTFTLNESNVSVSVVVDQITWNNAGGNATWNAVTTANFRNSANTDNTQFYTGDHVVFGNLTAGGTITVSGTVLPSSVTFDSTSNHTLQTGTIGGGGTLLKKNTGILTLSAQNTYSGTTTISEGEIRFSNATPLPNSPVVLNDALTGGTNTAILPTAAINGINNLNVTVANEGTGTVTLGSLTGQAGLMVYNASSSFNLNRPVVFNGSSDRTTIIAPISGTPGSIRIGGATNHRVTWAAANTFLGDLIISNGVLYQSDHQAALPRTTSVNGEGNAQFRINNGGVHVINALSGTGSTYIIAGGPATLSLGNNDGSGVYTGTVTANHAALAIIKNGTGSQSLIGDNTYTGTTTVNAGTLVLSPRTSAAAATTVADGATLGIAGAAGGTWNATALTLGASAGATLNIANFASGSTPIVNVDNLAANGSVQVNVTGVFEAGSYPLIDYAGSIGGAGFSAFQIGTLPRSVTANLSNDASQSRIMLNVTAFNPVTWTGNADDKWDIDTTQNWSLDGNDVTYLERDLVRFDDTAFETNIVVNAPVSPGAVVFDTEAAYGLSGTAGIAGSTGLLKRGSGTLSIANANTYTGGTSIQAGTLEITDSGSITGAITNAGTLAVNNGADRTFSNAMTGAGIFLKKGAGVLTMGIGQNHAGTAQVDAGVLLYNSTQVVSNHVINGGGELRLTTGGQTGVVRGTITINAGGTLNCTATNALGWGGGTKIDTLNIVGGLATTSAAGDQGWAIRVNMTGGELQATGAGYYAFGGGSSVSVLASENQAVINAPIRLREGNVDARVPFDVADGPQDVDLKMNGPFVLTGDANRGIAKLGSGTMELTNGGSTYNGPTLVNAGTLRLGNSSGSATGSGTVTVNAGGTLAGTGTASGAVTVNTGGTISPGTGVGTLGTGAATLAGTYMCEIDGTAADRINVTGNLNVDGATIAFSTLNRPTQPEYIIATYTGTYTGTPAAVTGMPGGYKIDVATPGQIKLVQSGGYAGWAADKGLLESNNGRSMDPDGDGVSNLREYYLAGDPLVPDSSILPRHVLDNDYLTFTFNRLDVASDEALAEEFQYGSNLLGWTSRAIAATTYPDGVVVEVVDKGATDAITVRIPRTLAAAGKLFGRLHIEMPE